MQLAAERYSQQKLTELEKDSIANYIVNESIEIVSEEVDYFFSSKEKLVEFFIEGIDFKKINTNLLQERFDQILYSPMEIEKFIVRIEKRIRREINRSQYEGVFKLNTSKFNKLISENETSLHPEEIRTLKMSTSMVNTINNLWRKSSSQFIPKEFKKYSAKVKVGEYFLATVGVSPKEVKESIKVKMIRRIKGTIKQNKLEINNLIKREIINQLFPKENANYYYEKLKVLTP